MRRFAGLFTAGALALVIAACGGSSKTAAPPAVTPTPAPAAATPGSPAPPAAPKDGEAADAAKKPAKARLVVIGTANLASNQFLGAQGNRDFFLNVVSWLAEDESQISVRARDTKSNPIVLSPPQAELVLWLPVAILPGAVVLAGIVAVVSRRRRSR